MVSLHYFNLNTHITFPNVLSHLLGRRHGHFQIITNLYIHLTFPNVHSHLLGRRHGPLQLITQFYIHITFSNVLSDLIGRRHGPLQLITNLYIHLSSPKCTLFLSHSQMFSHVYLGEEKSTIRMSEKL